MSDWDDIVSDYDCPVCGLSSVPISGSGNWMILGDAPDQTDITRGLAWQGRDGGILRTELQRLDVDMYSCKLGNLWKHTPNGNEECLQASVQHILENLKGVDAVLLCGKDVVEYITGYKVSLVSSLKVNSLYWSVPTWACYSPSMVFHSLGEFRLGLSRFVEANT